MPFFFVFLLWLTILPQKNRIYTVLERGKTFSVKLP